MGRIKGKKNKKPTYIWLKVSKDKYEWILEMGDSAEELAERCGISRNTIYVCASKYDRGLISFSAYRRVKI